MEFIEPNNASQSPWSAMALGWLLIIVVASCIYAAGYIMLGSRFIGVAGDGLVVVEVIYLQEWQETLFRPASQVESTIRRIHVSVSTPKPFRSFDVGAHR